METDEQRLERLEPEIRAWWQEARRTPSLFTDHVADLAENERQALKAAEQAKREANATGVLQRLSASAQVARDSVAAGGSPLQLEVPPTRWAMTMKQWEGYVDGISRTVVFKDLRRAKGYVHLYDINKHFVKPQTRNAGAGVALLLNQDEPLDANVMVSHAWGACIEETLQALRLNWVPDDMPIWFCLFANYQPGGEVGDCGPTVGQQLLLDPFKQIIESERVSCMLVVHTSRAEVYDRLWCVYEIDAAVEAKQLWGICSGKYSSNAAASDQPFAEASNAKILVHTSAGRCGQPEDEHMIRTAVEAKGGFGRLDKSILAFRKDMVAYNSACSMMGFLTGPGLMKIGMQAMWKDPSKFKPVDLMAFIHVQGEPAWHEDAALVAEVKNVKALQVKEAETAVAALGARDSPFLREVKEMFDVMLSQHAAHILVLGLPGAGKSALLNRLSLSGDVESAALEGGDGQVVESLAYHNVRLSSWDLTADGLGKGLEAWQRQHGSRVHAVVFVVDSGRFGEDRSGLHQEKALLDQLLEEESLRHAALFVFANKEDLPTALGCGQVAKQLGLSSLPEERTWTISGTCTAFCGEDLLHGWKQVAHCVSQRLLP